MSNSSLSSLKIFGSAAAMVVILLISTNISFIRFADLRRADQWDIHSYQVLLQTSHLAHRLVDMQTGVRGFVETGNEAFLQPYNSGLTQYETSFASAQQLTSDNPADQADLSRLENEFLDWNAGNIVPLIAMRRVTPDMPTAMRIARTGALLRKKKFDAMIGLVNGIEVRENDLLKRRSAKEGLSQDVAVGALLTNGVFAVLLATVLSLMLAGGARKLQSLNARLSHQRDQLERAERDAMILSKHNEMMLLAAQDGIAGINQAGRTTFFNPAAEKITGYRAEEVIGKLQHALLHGKHADGSEYDLRDCPIMATLRDGKSHHTRSEVFWHKNGKPIDIEFTSAPLYMRKDVDPYAETEDPGHQMGAVIMFRDIGEMKRAETAQRELASIVQYSEDSIIALNLNGVITRWNYAATKLYGYGPNEIVGHRIQRLLPPKATDDMEPMLEKIRKGERVERYESTRMHRDGTLVHVVVGLSPILDENGDVAGISSISRQVFRDRTQRPIGSRPLKSEDAEAPVSNEDSLSGDLPF